MARLTLDRLSMRFRTRRGESVTALQDISFEIKDREFAVLVGTSGCGKSTILRLVAGLLPPSDGRVLLDGRAVSGPGPERGMVFQSYTLFPWLTVRQNVEFGPRLRGTPPSERVAKCLRLATGPVPCSERSLSWHPFPQPGGSQRTKRSSSISSA